MLLTRKLRVGRSGRRFGRGNQHPGRQDKSNAGKGLIDLVGVLGNLAEGIRQLLAKQEASGAFDDDPQRRSFHTRHVRHDLHRLVRFVDVDRGRALASQRFWPEGAA